MKRLTFFSYLVFQFSFLSVSAQDIFLDTFIRKDGIYAVPAFEAREPRTLFAIASSKKKTINTDQLLSIEASDRIRRYTTNSFGDQKKEPFSYFRVLHDLEAEDSAAYFEGARELPEDYRSFFSGLFYLEKNRFEKAYGIFDNLVTTSTDSLVSKEAAFWKNATAAWLDDENEYNSVIAAYAALENASKESYPSFVRTLEAVNSPAYLFHKYLAQYNYNYRIKDYKATRQVYDSILAYVSHPKMKASLVKNRAAVSEMLEAKESFITAINNQLYHYEIDYMYDHLEAWGADTLTDREFAEAAGFILRPKFSSKTDTIFTRWLKDTAVNEPLSKFEVLSFIRTPPDKAGRRFVMVKLGFDNEDAYKKYSTFLADFKSKPIRQSVLQNNSKIREGNEFMLTQYFIAALYQHDDAVIKYELCLYLLEDAEGNAYAVDTLF